MITDTQIIFSQTSVQKVQPPTPLEKEMAKALLAITTKEGRVQPSFVKVTFQFSKAHKAFERMKYVFQSLDIDDDGSLSLIEIIQAVTQLGGDATAAELKELFETADADGSGALDFKEFVVFLCVCSLLGKMDKSCNLNVAFMCAVDAFSVFDIKKTGTIVFSELNEALQGRGSQDIMLARMKEMDADGDGSVIFPEFLIAFMGWVGVDDDEDDDEDE